MFEKMFAIRIGVEKWSGCHLRIKANIPLRYKAGEEKKNLLKILRENHADVFESSCAII